MSMRSSLLAQMEGRVPCPPSASPRRRFRSCCCVHAPVALTVAVLCCFIPERSKETVITTAAGAIALELHALGAECFFLMTGRDNTLWIALQEQGIRQVLAR